MRFAFIQAEKAAFPIAALCRALGVSRPGLYAWQTRPESGRVREDRGLAVEVAAIHAESHRCYGSPRVHAERAPVDGARVASVWPGSCAAAG